MQDFCFARKVLGEDFLYERHVNYLLKSLRKSTIGPRQESAEPHRLSSLFFVISGMDLLGELESKLTQQDRDKLIEWIYSYQVDINNILLPVDLCAFNERETRMPDRDEIYLSSIRNHDEKASNENPTATKVSTSSKQATTVIENNNNHSNSQMEAPPKGMIRMRRVAHAGFRSSAVVDKQIPFDCGTLTMSYCALATLVILGDDLNRVDRASIIEGMRQLQLPDGSFPTSALGGENDMRIVYCASAISAILNDWSGMDRDRCAEFIRQSYTHEGAFGQRPGTEAHGGSTFCAFASLKLMSKLDETLTQEEIERLIRWCMNRLDRGFSGRPNKDQDTCYSFWIGACLVILNQFECVDQKNLLDFILLAQEERGGLSKIPNYYSDPLHTYLGFAGLTFIDDALCLKRSINLLKIDPTLNISMRARHHLERIQESSFGRQAQTPQQVST